MNTWHGKHSIWIKTIAMTVVCLFLVNDIIWAQPTNCSPSDSTLAIQSIFNPIINAVGIQHQKQAELELSGIIAMALRGLKRNSGNPNAYKSFLNINSALDKRCSNPRHEDKGFVERALEVVGNPTILDDNPEGHIIIRIKTTANSATQKHFKIIFKGDKLDDMFDVSKIEIVEEQQSAAMPDTNKQGGSSRNVSETIDRLINNVNNIPGRSAVFIAGPSSGGKTTVSEGISARIRKDRKVIVLSLDRYYKNKEEMPKLNGKADFETPEAMHLDWVQEDIKRLLNGDEVDLPSFDITTGRSMKYSGEKARLGKDDILIVESLYALREEITGAAIGHKTIKVFVDVPTELRLLRRLVRDATGERQKPPYKTLKRWDLVREREVEFVMPLKNSADYRIENCPKGEFTQILFTGSMDIGNKGIEHLKEIVRLAAALDLQVIVGDNTKGVDHAVVREMINLKKGHNLTVVGANNIRTEGTIKASKQLIRTVIVNPSYTERDRFTKRDKYMVEMLGPQGIVYGIWDGVSPGTKGTFEYGRIKGKRTVVYNELALFVENAGGALETFSESIPKESLKELSRQLSPDEIRLINLSIEAMRDSISPEHFNALVNNVMQHGLGHALTVLSWAMRIVENKERAFLNRKVLILGALLHDIAMPLADNYEIFTGIPEEEQIKQAIHHTEGAKIADKILQKLENKGISLTMNEKERVNYVVLSHRYKEPYMPKGKLEAEAIYDADTLEEAINLGRYVAMLDEWNDKKEKKHEFYNSDISDEERIARLKDDPKCTIKVYEDTLMELLYRASKRNPENYITPEAKAMAKDGYDARRICKEICGIIDGRNLSRELGEEIKDKATRIVKRFFTDYLINYIQLAPKEIVPLELRERALLAFPGLDYSRTNIPFKMTHVLKVILCFNHLIHSDFEYFHLSFLDRPKGNKFKSEDEEAGYIKNLAALDKIYADLPPEVKNDLTLAIVLHDIGFTDKDTNDAGHPSKGAELARSILTGMKLSEQSIIRICKIIEYHDYVGNVIRAKKVPKVLRVLSPELLRLVVIANCMDMAGYGSGEKEDVRNNLIPESLAKALEYSDLDRLRNLDENNGYYEYRLKKLARRDYGEELTSEQFEQLTNEVDKIPEPERKLFVKNWNSHIEVREPTFFFNIAHDNNSFKPLPLVKVLRLIAQRAQEYLGKNADNNMFIIDTDINPGDIPKEVFNSIRSNIEKLQFTIKGNRLIFKLKKNIEQPATTTNTTLAEEIRRRTEGLRTKIRQEAIGKHDAFIITKETAALFKFAVEKILDEYSAKFGLDREKFAVLGYGSVSREEMVYCSDTDLILLCEGKEAEAKAEDVKSYITANLESVGLGRHKVAFHPWHTITDCLGKGYIDHADMSKLEGAVLIWGSESIFEEARGGAKRKAASSLDFRLHRFLIIDMALSELYKTYSAEEPNLKFSKGYLRDILNNIYRLPVYKYGEVVDSSTLKSCLKFLISKGDITDEQEENILKATSLFLLVRNELHILKGDEVDVLDKDSQPMIARQLGFNSAAELMDELKKYSESVNRITEYLRQRLIDYYVEQKGSLWGAALKKAEIGKLPSNGGVDASIKMVAACRTKEGPVLKRLWNELRKRDFAKFSILEWSVLRAIANNYYVSQEILNEIREKMSSPKEHPEWRHMSRYMGRRKHFQDISQDAIKCHMLHNNYVKDREQLTKRAASYLKDCPVDETIDLSLISKEDLEANMKTWAYIIALNNKHGLDVNYIFKSDDEAYKADAKKILLEKVQEIKGIDTEKVGARITDTCRSGALQIHIMKKEDLEKLKDIPEGVLPVALSEGTTLDGTPLRDFMSASAIGLAQAACKRMQIEKNPHLLEILEQEILPRIQHIYQRLFPDKDIKEIVTKETLLNMIDDNPIVRKNLAIALALPPIIRAAIQYLKDYHDRIHLLQQAA